MRIRKRTPAGAASPGPGPALSASPPPRPKGDDEGAEEKRVVLVAGVGGQEDGLVAAASKNSAMDDAPEPEPEPEQPQDAAGADGRCNRNDGKRWRCRNPAVPGFLFCDRHVAWSTRKRKPRARKQKKNQGGGGVFEVEMEDRDSDDPARTPQLLRDGDDGFYYYGGFQPGSRKRARGGGPA